VLVTGGRKYQRWTTVYGVLDEHHKRFPIRLLVQGGATGVDRFGREWAAHNGIPWKSEKPKYRRYGRGAPTVRNQEMLDKYKPRLVVAFPGNRGTLDMTRKAYAADCVREVDVINGEEHGRW